VGASNLEGVPVRHRETRSCLDAPYQSHSVLVFGNETKGMPELIRGKYPDRIFRIPMRSAVRSLNLATAVGAVLYESIRKLNIQLDDGTSAPPAKSGA
jgi:tRNA(Leu) C34 or U34 (ribose-2'-O)-methylase TrmL